MTVDDYEFQLDTGVLLNSDVDFPFVDVDRVAGLDSPPFRETTRDHEGTDGGFIDAEFEKGRDIILEGTVYADAATIEDYLDDIKFNYAPVTNPIPFYLKPPGVDERVIFVKPRGARYDWDTARRLGMTRIQFMMFAEDPRIYTNTLITTIIDFGGDAGIGFGFDLEFDLDFGGGATPGGANVVNDGNRPAPCILVINGPIINPIIYNSTTGNNLAFEIELGATDTLTIDTNNRTVYLNGNINRRNTLTNPDWFFIVPGTNQLSFGGQSGTGSTLTVTFRSAWR